MIDNWKRMLDDAFEDRQDSWDNVELNTLTDEQLNLNFDAGYGAIEGPPFTLWTHKYVYFPLCYDGAEWVGSVPRNPENSPTFHLGGG